MTSPLPRRAAATSLADLVRSEHGDTVVTGRVTAICTDGTVNVRIREALHTGVPCLMAYYSRTVGDDVRVLVARGTRLVLGPVMPAFVPQGDHAVQSVRLYRPDGSEATAGGIQQGCSGMGADATPLTTAFGFHDGVGNTLVNHAIAAPAGMWAWFARDTVKHGNPDTTQVLVYPHAYDALPASGFTPLAGWGPLAVPLQLGEARRLDFPGPWKTAIAAGTIRGFAVGGPTITEPGQDYAVFHDATGTYTTY